MRGPGVWFRDHLRERLRYAINTSQRHASTWPVGTSKQQLVGTSPTASPNRAAPLSAALPEGTCSFIRGEEAGRKLGSPAGISVGVSPAPHVCSISTCVCLPSEGLQGCIPRPSAPTPCWALASVGWVSSLSPQPLEQTLSRPQSSAGPFWKPTFPRLGFVPIKLSHCLWKVVISPLGSRGLCLPGWLAWVQQSLGHV